MKKPLVFVAAVCACALALHADFTYDNVFNAIGPSAASTNDLDSTGGSWAFAADVGEVKWENSSLAFDLEEDKSIAFTVADGAALDTNTVVKVEVKSLISEVSTNDLPTGAEMESRQAQLGFVIGINAAETPIATNYYAWTGGASWTLLSHPEGAEPSVTNETDFIVTFNYMTNHSHSVQFDIARGGKTYPLNGGAALPPTSTLLRQRQPQVGRRLGRSGRRRAFRQRQVRLSGGCGHGGRNFRNHRHGRSGDKRRRRDSRRLEHHHFRSG